MIHRVDIENYKSIRRACVDLRPLNMLIGANGAGKSNFISFFKLLNHIYEQNLQAFVIQAGADNLLHFGRKQSPHLGGSLLFGEAAGAMTNRYDFQLAPNARNSLSLVWEQVGFYKTSTTTWYNEHIIGDTLESGLKGHRTSVSRYTKIHLAGCRLYHFHDTGFTAPVKQFGRLHDNAFLREDGANLAAFLYRLQVENPESFRLVESTVRSVAPFFKAFDLSPNALNPDNIELKWLEAGSDMYLNAHNLSDGTLRMICLAALLLQPKLPDAVLIDEPELGLHPFAINKLAGLIKSAAQKGCQLIVSTQSVGLIDNFEPEDMLVADREDGQSVFKRLDTDALRNWLDEYSLGQLWEKNVLGGRP